MLRKSLTLAAALMAATSATAFAQPPVDFGNVELGEVRTACFTACFGTECSGTGTISTIGVAPPFFVRGVRTAPDDSDPCDTGGVSTPANLPVNLSPNEFLVWDVDLVPLDDGPVGPTPLSLNGSPAFDLEADVFPVFTCDPTQDALCLQDDRFKTRIHWRTNFGTRGSGQVVSGTAPDDSGLFYFFNPDNWEMLIKVLDGCNITNHFWVFAAATTNVEYTITVVDTQTQVANSYFKPQGPPAPAITDTSAFATCP